MTLFGWVLMVGGGLWIMLGLSAVTNIATDAALGETAQGLGMLLAVLLYFAPGAVVAGVGAILASVAGRRREG